MVNVALVVLCVLQLVAFAVILRLLRRVGALEAKLKINLYATIAAIVLPYIEKIFRQKD